MLRGSIFAKEIVISKCANDILAVIGFKSTNKPRRAFDLLICSGILVGENDKALPQIYSIESFLTYSYSGSGNVCTCLDHKGALPLSAATSKDPKRVRLLCSLAASSTPKAVFEDVTDITPITISKGTIV